MEEIFVNQFVCLSTRQDKVMSSGPEIIASGRVNPLGPTAIQKLLEIIDRVHLYPSFVTALDSDMNQTTGSGGHPSMWENRCMHASVCRLHAGQPRSAGDAAKLGQFLGKFSWVTGDPIGIEGLTLVKCQQRLVAEHGANVQTYLSLEGSGSFQNKWRW